MSGFDEEAERERLREKYEQNQEQRAATQRMSELLLKGATMTNSHCDACGDPLFRHDGQTFCPTCQAADAEQTADAKEAADAEQTVDAEQSVDAQQSPADQQSTDATAVANGTPTPPTTGTSRSQPSSSAPSTDTQPQPTPTEGDDPRSTARASLSRTLVKYSQAAEETDDPRRAKELLAAAREAAETLSALD